MNYEVLLGMGDFMGREVVGNQRMNSFVWEDLIKFGLADDDSVVGDIVPMWFPPTNHKNPQVK